MSLAQWKVYDSWWAPYLNLKYAVTAQQDLSVDELPCEPLLDYLGRSWWAGTYFEQITGHRFNTFVASAIDCPFADMVTELIDARKRFLDEQAQGFDQVLQLIASEDEIRDGWGHFSQTSRLAKFNVHVQGAFRLYGHPLGEKTARNLLIRTLVAPELRAYRCALLADFFLPDLRSSCVIREEDGSLLHIREMDELAWKIPLYPEKNHRGPR